MIPENILNQYKYEDEVITGITGWKLSFTRKGNDENRYGSDVKVEVTDPNGKNVYKDDWSVSEVFTNKNMAIARLGYIYDEWQMHKSTKRITTIVCAENVYSIDEYDQEKFEKGIIPLRCTMTPANYVAEEPELHDLLYYGGYIYGLQFYGEGVIIDVGENLYMDGTLIGTKSDIVSRYPNIKSTCDIDFVQPYRDVERALIMEAYHKTKKYPKEYAFERGAGGDFTKEILEKVKEEILQGEKILVNSFLANMCGSDFNVKSNNKKGMVILFSGKRRLTGLENHLITWVFLGPDTPEEEKRREIFNKGNMFYIGYYDYDEETRIPVVQTPYTIMPHVEFIDNINIPNLDNEFLKSISKIEKKESSKPMEGQPTYTLGTLEKVSFFEDESTNNRLSSEVNCNVLKDESMELLMNSTIEINEEIRQHANAKRLTYDLVIDYIVKGINKVNTEANKNVLEDENVEMYLLLPFDPIYNNIIEGSRDKKVIHSNAGERIERCIFGIPYNGKTENIKVFIDEAIPCVKHVIARNKSVESKNEEDE